MKKIIFDVTVLVDGDDMKEERRGIYNVAKNLLLEMCRQNKSEIILYASGCKMAGLPKVIADLHLSIKPYRSVPVFGKMLHKVTTFCRKKRMQPDCNGILKSLCSLAIFNLAAFSSIYFSCLNIGRKYGEDTVFFSPRTSAPWFINRQKLVKKYIVLHDLIPVLFKNSPEMLKWGWFAYLLRTLNGNDFYFAISENTKKDYCEYCKKIDPSHIKVIHWAAGNEFFPQKDLDTRIKLKNKYGIPTDKLYVFACGGQDPRKNVARIVRTFTAFKEKNKIDDLFLVVSGCQENKDDGFVLYRSYIDDMDLPLLYSNAEWFVFTSQYEGFGLPPLEAMQCGCPVIASNNSSIPEVVGDAGLLIDWDSDEQHVDAYEKYYFNETLRKDNGDSGLKRAKLFSWEKTTKEILATINESC
jgi:glycosyltransferase involved in cell wall biosynthesis